MNWLGVIGELSTDAEQRELIHTLLRRYADGDSDAQRVFILSMVNQSYVRLDYFGIDVARVTGTYHRLLSMGVPSQMAGVEAVLIATGIRVA